jgi:DNA repair exonuclease SbcCD ATPase subunit
MRVLELLEEIEEIVDTAAGFPLTGKIMVDSQELLEIVREIRAELPDEIQQAQWIKNERERIIDEAKHQYEAVISDAQKQADVLVETNDITVKSKMRADELMKVTENTARQLKIGTYDYLDGILYSFQGKMSQLSDLYFGDMFSNLEKAFKDINEALEANREELKDMAYRAQMDENPEFKPMPDMDGEPMISDDTEGKIEEGEDGEDKVDWAKN